MPRTYKAELEQERKVLGELLREREELETKIAKQQTRVAALAALSEQSEEVDDMAEMELGGLTNACRTAFRAAGNRGLMPTEVRGALEQLRFPTRSHKNILASIHTVIRRFEQAVEILKAVQNKNHRQGKSRYARASPDQGAANNLGQQKAESESA